ncbi:hypothetical protein [Burkholderia sp. ABCPW 14]|uniref:hypothetical protein n=1 Tax=Burkholderia sp. ABCPW 14 TaxID=1637860 RepID=UPI000A540D11|nr:hypothetical protein [Burkholderia sp. ABCPW 14]
MTRQTNMSATGPGIFERLGADTGRLNPAPVAIGLYSISVGLSGMRVGDHEQS